MSNLPYRAALIFKVFASLKGFLVKHVLQAKRSHLMLQPSQSNGQFSCKEPTEPFLKGRTKRGNLSRNSMLSHQGTLINCAIMLHGVHCMQKQFSQEALDCFQRSKSEDVCQADTQVGMFLNQNFGCKSTHLLWRVSLWCIRRRHRTFVSGWSIKKRHC